MLNIIPMIVIAVGITVIELYAMYKGHNGKLAMLAVGALALMAGIGLSDFVGLLTVLLK